LPTTHDRFRHFEERLEGVKKTFVDRVETFHRLIKTGSGPEPRSIEELSSAPAGCVLCKQAPPLTVTAAVKKIVWDDVWTLPKNASALVQESRGDAVAATTSVELVPYGCSKVYKISMFPYV
jgi:hypothetical protein